MQYNQWFFGGSVARTSVILVLCINFHCCVLTIIWNTSGVIGFIYQASLTLVFTDLSVDVLKRKQIFKVLAAKDTLPGDAVLCLVRLLGLYQFPVNKNSTWITNRVTRWTNIIYYGEWLYDVDACMWLLSNLTVAYCWCLFLFLAPKSTKVLQYFKVYSNYTRTIRNLSGSKVSHFWK